MIDFEPTSLYTSAMWDDNSLHPNMETGFAFEPYLNDVSVEAFNIQRFNHKGKESAIVKNL